MHPETEFLFWEKNQKKEEAAHIEYPAIRVTSFVS
jgi:hypothetical protein